MTNVVRLTREVLAVGEDDYYYYIILNQRDSLALVSNPKHVENVLNYLMEELVLSGIERLLVVISVPLADIVSSASLLRSLFPNVLTAASRTFAPLIRNGKCPDSECPHLDVSLEVKDKTSYNNLAFVETNVPIRGSVATVYSEFVITYEAKASPYGKIRYICDKSNCYTKRPDGLRSLL